MGQVLHGSATTTHAIRAAIQRSKASLQALSDRYGIDPKTVAKWRMRTSLEDRPMGPKVPRSTVLSTDEETLIVAFRRHTLLPLDDCLYALQATIPHLTRSSLHRLFQRHGISRLPSVEGPPSRRQFRAYPLGYVHIDLAEVSTEEGKLYLFVAIDRSASLPSPSSTNRPRAGWRRTSFDGSLNACPTAFTRSSRITAFSSRRRRAAGVRGRSNSC